MSSSNETYTISSVNGGESPLFNFPAPPEYFLDVFANDTEHETMLRKYFRLLYPLSNFDRKSFQDLKDLYYNLDFWYCFNDSWSVSPFPVTLDKRVVDKWEKNTFYQAGTIVQSNITSWCWGLDRNGNKVVLPARLNNGPQVDASFTYYNAEDGKEVKIRSVTTDKNFWNLQVGSKMEITSWGWNPYPFGIYAQGPFKGSGMFLEIPKNAVIGTCHWDIIHQCKSQSVSDSELIALIMNHEMNSASASYATLTYKNNFCSPTYLVRNEADNNSYSWQSTNLPVFPLALAYSLFIMGGFDNTIAGFSSSAQKPYDNFWDISGYKMAIVLSRRKTDNKLYFPVDQSFDLGNGNTRTSESFWEFFMNQFFSKLKAWDTNWVQNMWRFPIFDLPNGLGPVVTNPSDDLMMAMATGNMDIVNFSPWRTENSENVDKKFSKYANQPLTYSHYILPNGTMKKGKSNGQGFPVGMTNKTSTTPCFCIRTQMPNVNGDLCTEFADFRCTTPGNLNDGSGDQGFWAMVFKYYAKNFLYTVDIFNPKNYKKMKASDLWLPKTDLKKVKINDDRWKTQENQSLSKTFFDFDPYYGEWCGDNAYIQKTQKSNFKQLPYFLGPGPAGAYDMSGNNYQVNGNITALFCNAQVKPFGNIKNYDFVETKMGGQPFTGGNICEMQTCTPGNGWICYTFAQDSTEYFPSPVDTFGKGTVGFMRVPGACNTRWCLSSKDIPWRFDAPLANLLVLKNDTKINLMAKSSVQIFGIFFLLVIFLVCMYFLIFKDKEEYGKQLILFTSVAFVLLLLLVFYLVLEALSQNERKRLYVYLANLYPAIPSSVWQKFSLDDFRTFFSSLHFWYKDENIINTLRMPSPKDYLHQKKFWNIPPYDMTSDWKNFTVRKNSVIGYPQVIDENDHKITVGWDNLVNTSATDTPSGILFRGRQLQDPDTTNFQKTTFFEPTGNVYIDTYNCFTGVNDPNLKAWEDCEYVEVSSQWGPFPDGAYFDYAPGSGCFMKLGKHKVGYNGMHLVMLLGDEMMENNKNNPKNLYDIYWQGWQRAGFGGTSNNPSQDTMMIDFNGVITLNSKLVGSINGLYSTLVMTSSQINQITTAKDETGKAPINNVITQPHPADNIWWSLIAGLMGDKFKYFDYRTQQWVKDMPNTADYVKNYPFPLPFGSEKMVKGDVLSLPKLNDNALSLPWKYQMFNICELFRSLTLSAVFLNENSISYSDIEKRGCDYNFVDLLYANQKSPLPSPRSWGEAVDVICGLLVKPLPHPFFSLWTRIESYLDDQKNIIPLSSAMDGPELILTSYINKIEPSLTFERVYKGAIDKTKYVQDTLTNKGYDVKQTNNLPQFQYANLDIDHWQSSLANALDYDTLCRIQHWCGSKNIAYDTELINLRIAVPGNLLANTLNSNIFEIWKQGNKDWFTTKNPLDPKNNPYAKKYETLLDFKLMPQDLTSTNLSQDWVKPPWTGFNESQSLYGWPCEDLNNFMITNRLSFSPMTNTRVPYSLSFPEYNKYIFNYLMSVVG